MAYKVEKLTEGLLLGEGPHWDETTQSLYFTDIIEGSIHRYTPKTKSHTKVIIGGDFLPFIIPVEGRPNTFVIGSCDELSLITWDGKSDKLSSSEILLKVESDGDGLPTFNDAKVDSSGRLWGGVLYRRKGVLNVEDSFYNQKGFVYSLNQNKSLKRQADNITLTNGLAWNDALKKFYYIDSFVGVYQFDYDAENAEISNRQIVFTFSKNNVTGVPDGMAIDSDGNLWIADFGGGSVVKVDPRRPETLLQIVDIPAKQVASVAFGGSNYDELYVTTSKAAIDPKSPPLEDSLQGATFKVTGLGVKGLPAFNVKL